MINPGDTIRVTDPTGSFVEVGAQGVVTSVSAQENGLVVDVHFESGSAETFGLPVNQLLHERQVEVIEEAATGLSDADLLRRLAHAINLAEQDPELDKLADLLLLLGFAAFGDARVMAVLRKLVEG